MKYKIYTLQHQRLYDQIHGVQCTEKTKKIINKETLTLLDRCKEIRRDFAMLSKIRGIDSLFSDILIRHKRKTYLFEHIVVTNNIAYILERKKAYDNQKQLLKEKVSYLKKALGKDITIKYYILTDSKTTKPDFISIESFIDKCRKENSADRISSHINEFIQKRHANITIIEYIQKRYNIDITKTDTKRKSKWTTISKITSPLVSKYKGTLSFASSGIILFYILSSVFSYSIYAKERQFLLTLGIDCLFLFLLVNLLKEIESKLHKFTKIIVLTIALFGFMFLFYRVMKFL